jgi:hypothetical protein
MSRVTRIAASCAFVVAVTLSPFAAQPVARGWQDRGETLAEPKLTPHPDADAAIEKFLGRPARPHQYRAGRRLEASGSGQRAWLQVRTDYEPLSGMRYEVTAEGGSGYIRSRVLRSLLDEEQRLIALGTTGTVALSTNNYQFTSEGINADGLAVIAMKPLRKERSLIVGRMFLDPATGDLVRVEGRLAKTPSFWLKRVDVVRAYRRVNDVVVPVSLQTTGQLRLLGRSTLNMTYEYSEVDERPVAESLEAGR